MENPLERNVNVPQVNVPQEELKRQVNIPVQQLANQDQEGLEQEGLEQEGLEQAEIINEAKKIPDHMYNDNKKEVDKFYNEYTNLKHKEIESFDKDDKSTLTTNKRFENIEIKNILGEKGNVKGLSKLFQSYLKYYNNPDVALADLNENTEVLKSLEEIYPNYAEEISNQISIENKNKVAIFKYKVYLYNIDKHLLNFIDENKSVFTENTDVNKEIYKFYDKLSDFNKKIREKYFKNINLLIKNKNELNNDNYNQINFDYDYEFMNMYIPKLLTTMSEELEEPLDVNNRENVGNNEMLGGGLYPLSKLKDLQNKDKVEKKIRNNFNNVNGWKTVLNDDKHSHYGFNGEEPGNVGETYYLSTNRDKIQKYVDKCNDLQIFYIKKHIELFEIFKLMNKYIKFNIDINEIIKNLVDPEYYKKYNDKKKIPIKLPKMLTDLENTYLKPQKDISKMIQKQNENVNNSNSSMTGGSLNNLSIQQPLPPPEQFKNELFTNENVSAFGRNLKTTSNKLASKQDLQIDVENFDEILNKSDKSDKNEEPESENTQPKLKKGQTLYLTFKNGEKFMMTLKEISNDNNYYIFHNILSQVVNPNKKLEELIENLNDIKDVKVEYVNYIVDSIESFEILQAIKRIQLLNDQSLRAIIGKKNNDGKTTLDQIIDEYKQNIDDNNFEDVNKIIPKNEKSNSTADSNLWNSFNTKNTKGVHFDLDDLHNTTDNTTDDEAIIQAAIYKCYDLQILYLVKHLEIIEMFKLVFYFYDMLIKKIGVLFLILALYKRYKLDLNELPMSVTITKIIEDIPDMLNLQKKTTDFVKTNPVETPVKPIYDSQYSLDNEMHFGGGNSERPEIVTEQQNKLRELQFKAIVKYNENMDKILKRRINSLKNESKDITREMQTKCLKKLEEIQGSEPQKNDDSKIVNKFNILLKYFKEIQEKSDNYDDFSKKSYNYIDKLLIEILQKYLNVVKFQIKIDKGTDNNSFNLLKNIYYDIDAYLTNIDIIRTSIKKRRSTYSTVKIGQFSKDDLVTTDEMLKTFHDSFRNKYKEDLEIDKQNNIVGTENTDITNSETSATSATSATSTISTNNVKVNKTNSFSKKFPKESLDIQKIITEIKKIQTTGGEKTKNSKSIDDLITNLSHLYYDLFNDLHLYYISKSIYENSNFTNDNIPDDISIAHTSPQQYKLSYLELLHKTYLSNDENFNYVLSLNNENNSEKESWAGGGKNEKELQLLKTIIQQVGHMTLDSRNKDTIFITEDSYKELKKK